MLKQRILTAIVLLALLAVVLFLLPQEWVVAVLGVIVLGGAWEWSALAGLRARVTRVAFLLATLFAMAVAWLVSGPVENFERVMMLALAGWLLVFAWMMFAPRWNQRALASLAGLWILVPAWLAMSRLYLQVDQGPALIIFGLVLTWAADIGAYFVGRAYGRIKLAPALSPNKTWEGVLGGLLASLLVAFAGYQWFGLPAVAFISLCVAVMLASVVGDLAESMFKRQRGLKDSGRLLPGHGGILDRIDSLTAAFPLLALGLVWLGQVT